MNTDRKHSPEKVREYFDLLEWYRNSQTKELLQDKLPIEDVNSDEILILCRDSLKDTNKNIESISLEVSLLTSQFQSLVNKLENLEQDLNSKLIEINDLSIIVSSDRRRSINRSVITNTSKNNFYYTKPSLREIFYTIFLSIITE